MNIEAPVVEDFSLLVLATGKELHAARRHERRREVVSAVLARVGFVRSRRVRPFVDVAGVAG